MNKAKIKLYIIAALFFSGMGSMIAGQLVLGSILIWLAAVAVYIYSVGK